MLTDDFVRKTRERVADTHATLTKFRELTKEVAKQLAKIHKQHVADRNRLYEHLGQLGDDVVGKLPEEATDSDYEKARAIQDQINDLAADVEEISLASSTAEDLVGVAKDTVDDAYRTLRETEAQITKVERLATKLGI